MINVNMKERIMEPEQEDVGTISLFEELGVSDERAYEINIEIMKIRDSSELLSETLSAIPESYDRESILMGVFLYEIILKEDGRLLPPGINGIAIPLPSKEILDDIIRDILSRMGGDEEVLTKGDPTQN